MMMYTKALNICKYELLVMDDVFN